MRTKISLENEGGRAMRVKPLTTLILLHSTTGDDDGNDIQLYNDVCDIEFMDLLTILIMIEVLISQVQPRASLGSGVLDDAGWDGHCERAVVRRRL